MNLKVWSDKFVWLIAESAEDARAVYCETTGEKLDDYDPKDLEQWPDDKPITIFDSDTNTGPKTTLLPAEWIARRGRGFLCTTER